LRTVPWLCRGRGRMWSLAVAALERHNRLLDLIPQGAIGHETRRWLGLPGHFSCRSASTFGRRAIMRPPAFM
jgi:hypothetical protein